MDVSVQSASFCDITELHLQRCVSAEYMHFVVTITNLYRHRLMCPCREYFYDYHRVAPAKMCEWVIITYPLQRQNLASSKSCIIKILQRQTLAASKSCSVKLLQRQNLASSKSCSVRILQRQNQLDSNKCCLTSLC